MSERHFMASVVPALIVLFAVIVCAIPWGLPDGATFILPLVTATPIFYLSAQPDRGVPVWLAFLAGLATDILTAGPLGYWALIFLLTHSLAKAYRQTATSETFGGLWLGFALTLAVVAALGWALASLYFVRFIDWRPMVIGAVAATLLFPLVTWPIGRLLRWGEARSGGLSFRSRA
ncbi:MAG: rod shape-determining protein MreD [Methyloligellaceae bacterium]